MIFTNGDSFTYGDELDKPYTQAWPYVLTQMLNLDMDLDIVNFGENSQDNASILQTTKDYYDQKLAKQVGWKGHFIPNKLKQLSNPEPKVWIIQWTTFRRFRVNPPMDIVLQKQEKQYLLDLYFIQVRDMQEWFESHGFPYLMFNAFDNERYISDSYSEFKSLVDDKYFIGWPDEAVVNWIWEYERKPKGHPSAEAHVRIAEIVYENIRNKLRIS